MAAQEPAVDATEPPFNRQFVLVTAAAAFYFLGLGALAPVLPRYVEDVLDGDKTQVGIAVGAFAVSAALLRPWIGRLGDRHGRRLLLVGGSLVAGLSMLGYGLRESLVLLVLLRLVTGAGEAAAFIGAATIAQDLAPPDRRGQATSYFSIAVYGGLAVGPPLGEWAATSHGFDTAWIVAAAACLVGSLLGLTLPADRPSVAPPSPAGRSILQRDALRPGVILALGASGYAAFSSFVPLYVDEVGLDGAGVPFVEYAVIVLAVRIVGARIPDRLGTRTGPLAALALQSVGLVTMGVWSSALGLYVGTAVYAGGVSLLYPALFPLVVREAPAAERVHAIATFTLFFDLSQGFGAPLLGMVASLTDERGAFIGAGVLSALGLVLHRQATSGAAPSSRDDRADAEGGGADHERGGGPGDRADAAE